MKNHRIWPALVIALVILSLGFCAALVPGQGGPKRSLPPNAPANLRSFDFVTVTLDSSGNSKSRDRKSAYAFTEDLGRGVKLEMVAIPPGEFMMGSPEVAILTAATNRTNLVHRPAQPQRAVLSHAAISRTRSAQEGRSDEYPQHRVRIGYWFYLGKFEVTQAQWRAVMGTNPSDFKDCDECPVDSVSWDNAVEFCRKLSARMGREYRLPSEAEWEYAARAGTTTPFAFGETITPEIVNYWGDYPYAGAAKGITRLKTVPVGSLGVANAFGLYDMHGNVWEWCQDRYHDGYSIKAGDAPADGSAWVTGEWGRVLRGGSFFDTAYVTRSAVRSNYNQIAQRVGFRLAVR